MKNRHFVLLLFLFQVFISNSFAQLWYTTRGLPNQDERAWGVDVDSAGNVYWAVEEKDQSPYLYFNITLFKTDSDAHQVWQSASWGWNYNDIAFITKIKGQTVYLGGRTDSTNAIDGSGGNALVLSYSANSGSLNWQYIWDQGFGYEEIDGLIVQPDGIYLSGWSKGQTSDMDFLVQKISLTGERIWSNTWDYNNRGKFDGANGHMAMDDNFIYAAGHVNRTNIGSLDGDGALVCFRRADGAYQWHVIWGGALYDDALGLTMSADSMLYVVGFTGSFGKGSQCYLNKYSRTGQLKWSRIWGGTGTEDARALVTDSDSIVYVVGTTSSYGHGGKDIFILKYDSGGTLIDSLFWGGSYDEIAHDVAMYGDYLYVAGETSSFGNAQSDGHEADGLLLKVNGRTMKAPEPTPTTVPDNSNPIPRAFAVYQNYPNPFNPTTTIRFSLPQRSHVMLKVFDVLGREVATLVDGEFIAGEHSVVFDAKRLASGVYFYRLITPAFSQTKPMEVIK